MLVNILATITIDVLIAVNDVVYIILLTVGITAEALLTAVLVVDIAADVVIAPVVVILVVLVELVTGSRQRSLLALFVSHS